MRRCMSRNSASGSVRVKRRTPFVIIESATARDTRLSYRELGEAHREVAVAQDAHLVV